MFGYWHADLNRFNRPVRTRMPVGVAGERILVSAPYADFFAAMMQQFSI